MMKHYRKSVGRQGVTVLEVLFATGIAIFGLLGIYSLLPLAARQANEANEATEGQAYGQRYYSEFLARGFNRDQAWSWFDDRPGSFGFQAVDQPANVNNYAPTTTVISAANRHAICVDPGFFADTTGLQAILSYDPDGDMNPGFPSSQDYRVSLFPYFQTNYNPLTAADIAAESELASPHARLLRISLRDFNSTSSLPIPAKVAQELFRSVDDLAISRPEDRTIPPERIFQNGQKALSRAEYSWLATLVPNEQDLSSFRRSYYTLSIVVFHRRDAAWVAPSPVDRPQGERLFAVAPLSGNFRRGDGGRVLLTTNESTDDTIGIGDWVMLSRFINADRVVAARWYRVIGLGRDVVEGSGTWGREVVLDGPDWIFDGPIETQATLLSNVITVMERAVPVN